jgi:hypothetical protein
MAWAVLGHPPPHDRAVQKTTLRLLKSGGGVTGEKSVARLNGVLAKAVKIVFPVNSGVSWGGNSAPPVERGADGFFLRAGRIQGGRAELTMSSRELV